MLKNIRFSFLLFIILFNQNFAQENKWPNGITYEIFVQAFADSDKDGIGDFNGIISKLDYLKELGVGGLWLMPIHPSDSEHKYDVKDYYDVHPDYGTMDEFKNLVKEAHKRNIKIVIDLVINHSSRNHPWFQSAMNDLKSPYRDYYVWADDEEIKKVGETKKATADSDNRRVWNKVEKGDEKFYAYFGGGMPDLNFDNPKVREEVFKIGKFWLSEIGVDGFRLDAAKHIYPDERAADNHNWWIYFRKEMQKAKKDVYIVGEVWDKSENVAPYFQGLNAVFNFDLGYSIVKILKAGKDSSLVNNLIEVRRNYHSFSPDYIDATFLTNHDQTRILSELNEDRNKAKVAAALLFTLPGSPYVYYGEEIGMIGKKPDRYIREPFIWSPEKENGQVTWLEPRYSNAGTVVPVYKQMKDENSFYNHYKKLINLRNSNEVLTFGELKNVESNDRRIISFIRNYKDDKVLVIHNISGDAVKFELTEKFKNFDKEIYSTSKSKFEKGKNEILISPYGTVILKR